ncbi:PREDICTED: A disintegrin and metalloproteinase with thrombospondin motifs 15-like, partial [Tinamus guttatus]|uniref:A disintegrin and metalloproteinase with thrombospondin motifs 15-like n=1 Tax=Tinamus guttatus TaxID=94827 RepID=UPI00052EB86A
AAASRCAVASGLNPGILQALDKYRARGPPPREAGPPAGRAKRFVSVPRYVETLVVADESMVKFHGDDLQHYLLTLMATAARLYKHPSIRNPIDIVVVKFLVIGQDDKGPKVTGNAALTLRNFCAWQKKWNKGSDKHPEYWDTAILFTKQDLCGATTCDTLGMADVGTMCDPKRSCSVIEDAGLPSAFTTAHELGHVFNMPHDNVKACEEVFGQLKTNHMMSPTLIQIDRANPWSPCSAAIITDFLDSGHGDCLLDQPAKAMALPAELPGSSYSLGQQCQLAFGVGDQCGPFTGYGHSTNRLTASVSWVPKYSGVSPRDKCKLICRANGTGYFYVLAPKVVDGTPCSPDSTSVCVQGKCIKAGCDGKLGSKKKFDKCSVCGGDNKSCKKVSGLFTKPMHGYNFVVVIPAGASNIDIRQRGYKGLVSDDNYLALKNGQGKYLLNGHFIVSAVERDLMVKGSVLRYSGTGTAVESLQAFKPIQEPLTLEVLSVGKMTPPRVRYSFYLPKESKEDKSAYRKEGKGPPDLTNSVLSVSNRVDAGRPSYKRPSYK